MLGLGKALGGVEAHEVLDHLELELQSLAGSMPMPCGPSRWAPRGRGCTSGWTAKGRWRARRWTRSRGGP
eukprot:968000-Prymnesium_polylepis.1